MSFAIIDRNCSYIDIEPIKKKLEKENVTILEQQMGQKLTDLLPEKRSVGIYITNISDVALKHQCDLIRDSELVSQWLLIIVDGNNSSRTARNVAVTQFRQSLAKSDKDCNIICGDSKSVAEQIPEELVKLIRLQSNIVLITSAKNQVGRKTTANVLAELNPDYNFEVCDLKDLSQKKDYARHIIIVGAQPRDFDVPCIDGARFKLTLIYNKVDCAPIKAIYAQREKEAVLRVLNKNNWDIANTFSEFYMCSMKYEKMYLNARSYMESADSLRIDREFVMWDKYGLPCSAEEYNSENINRFLTEISIADKILK